MPTTPDDVTQAVLDAAVAPRKATGDSGSVERHSLADQIEADKYTRSTSATSPAKKLQFTKMIPPGAA